jgi:membrane protein
MGRFSVLRQALARASADNVTTMAGALAYYAFLAIPAVLLLAAGVFSLLAGPHAVSVVTDRLGGVVPAEAITLVQESLSRLTHEQATGVALIVVGALLALWSVGGAVQSIMWALNIAYEREETRGFVRRRMTAFAIVGLALLGVGLTVGLLVLGPHLTRWIGDAVGHRTLVSWIWWTAQWPILIGGLVVAFAGVLVLGPDVERPRPRFVTPGVLVAVVVWLAASALFAVYASRFSSYNKAWGSLSVVVVTLVWLWLSGVALLLGAEIDAELERRGVRENEQEAARPRSSGGLAAAGRRGGRLTSS